MNYLSLAEKLVSKALSAGADAAEIYISAGRNLSVNILNNEIETIEEADSAGVGIRIITGGSIGFSYSNSLEMKALEDTIAMAVKFARLTTPDENNVLPELAGETAVQDLYDPEIEGVPLDRKIAMALELEKLAMSDTRITKSSGSSYGESVFEVVIASSSGQARSYRASGCSLGVSVVAEKGDQKKTGGEYSSRRFFSDLTPADQIAAKAARKAWEMLDPRMVKTQKAAVIFDPDVAGSLLRGVIAALNGERVLQGASFLAQSMGKQFASPLLTIIDDGTRPRSMGASPFDGEGVPTQRRVLVDRGVVNGFLYNTIAARRAGTQSTGNASRNGYTSLPGIGTHHLSLETGKQSRSEIIAATDRGLLLSGVTGYGIDAVSGNFSGGASGFWIEKGEILYPVEGLTIAGSGDAILNGIDMMGNDIDMNRSFAAPTFRVAEMQIGGI
ncbi:MAG: TldD/PmbA family protein [Bacteroidales bacterium]|nr:TldD/PmbA family protein [Bacteroidales bacterium]